MHLANYIPTHPARTHELEVAGEGFLKPAGDWECPAGVEFVHFFEELDSDRPPYAWWAIYLWLRPDADAASIDAHVRRYAGAQDVPAPV